MTEAERIVKECERLGVLLTLGESSSALAFDAPADALTREMQETLAQHKIEIIQILFEHEERAALAGAPDWANASMWASAVNHPALDALRRLGVEVISVRLLCTSNEALTVMPGDHQVSG